VIDAVLRGGGEAIGVIPHALVLRELAHAGLSDLRVVASMHERKAMMEDLSDGFIALPGGIGTFEELLENQAFFSILDQTEGLSDTDVLMTGGLDDREVSVEDHLLPLYRKLRANDREGRVRFIVYQTDHSYQNVSDRLIADVAGWIEGK